MSLAKNLKQLTSLVPRPIVTWDKAERIRRNEEIWRQPDSIVHRLPEHYKQRYWQNVLSDVQAVHYRQPTSRLQWDETRQVEVPVEDYPIRGMHTPQQDEGLWGGEGVVKGWIESRPYTKKKVLPRYWVPRLFFPYLKKVVLYSEILDKHMAMTVTERACRLIDSHFGLDLYLLETPEIDIASKLGNRLKRELLLSLARGEYYPEDEERREYIKQKYARFVVSEEEAEWVGLDLNEAARKQQDREESAANVPDKYRLESVLVQKLRSGSDLATEEAEFVPKTEESKFGDQLLGKYLNPIGQKLKQ